MTICMVQKGSFSCIMYCVLCWWLIVLILSLVSSYLLFRNPLGIAATSFVILNYWKVLIIPYYNLSVLDLNKLQSPVVFNMVQSNIAIEKKTMTFLPSKIKYPYIYFFVFLQYFTIQIHWNSSEEWTLQV